MLPAAVFVHLVGISEIASNGYHIFSVPRVTRPPVNRSVSLLSISAHHKMPEATHITLKEKLVNYFQGVGIEVCCPIIFLMRHTFLHPLNNVEFLGI